MCSGLSSLGADGSSVARVLLLFGASGLIPLLGEFRRRGLRQDRRGTRQPNRLPPGGTSNRREVRAADRRSLSPAGAGATQPAKRKPQVVFAVAPTDIRERADSTRDAESQRHIAYISTLHLFPAKIDFLNFAGNDRHTLPKRSSPTRAIPQRASNRGKSSHASRE